MKKVFKKIFLRRILSLMLVSVLCVSNASSIPAHATESTPIQTEQSNSKANQIRGPGTEEKMDTEQPSKEPEEPIPEDLEESSKEPEIPKASEETEVNKEKTPQESLDNKKTEPSVNYDGYPNVIEMDPVQPTVIGNEIKGSLLPDKKYAKKGDKINLDIKISNTLDEDAYFRIYFVNTDHEIANPYHLNKSLTSANTDLIVNGLNSDFGKKITINLADGSKQEGSLYVVTEVEQKESTNVLAPSSRYAEVLLPANASTKFTMSVNMAISSYAALVPVLENQSRERIIGQDILLEWGSDSKDIPARTALNDVQGVQRNVQEYSVDETLLEDSPSTYSIATNMPTNISGSCYLSDNRTSFGQTTTFTVTGTHPVSQKYYNVTGICNWHGKVAPANGWYSYTGVLEEQYGRYKCTVARATVHSKSEISHIDTPYLQTPPPYRRQGADFYLSAVQMITITKKVAPGPHLPKPGTAEAWGNFRPNLTGAYFNLWGWNRSQNGYQNGMGRFTDNGDGTYTNMLELDKAEDGFFVITEPGAPAGFSYDYYKYCTKDGDDYNTPSFGGRQFTISNGKITCYSLEAGGYSAPNDGFIFLDYPSNSKREIKITKVDSKNPDKKLAGAKFELWGWKYKPEPSAYQVKIGDFTDNGDGTYTISFDYNDSDWSSYVKCYSFEVRETQPPKGYKLDPNFKNPEIYYDINGNITSSSPNSNNIVIKNEQSTSGLSLKKQSSNPEITNLNPCYSLLGAEYGVYTDPAAKKNKVGTLITDEKGNSNQLDLDPGTYYVKEEKAPMGYELSPIISECIVTAMEDFVLNVQDKPVNDPGGIKLDKIDKIAGKPVTSLAGAQFTVNYYAGYYDKFNLPKIPTRSWVIETKPYEQKGKIIYRTQLEEKYKISGDEFYYNGINVDPVIPLGTLTIQETKAPDYYTKNGATYKPMLGGEVTTDDIFLSQIRSKDDGVKLEAGNHITVKEERAEANCSISVGKTILASDYHKKDGTLTFEFQLEGTDVYGESHTYTETVDFTEEYIKDNTNESGTVTNLVSFTKLQPGNYVLTEKEHPEFIVKDIQVSGDAVVEGNKVKITLNDRVTVNFTNERSTGTASIQKTSSKPEITDNNSCYTLNGAEYGVYKDSAASKDKVGTLVTDSSGVSPKLDLTAGTYYIKEEKAPKGYLLDETIYTCEVKSKEDTVLSVSDAPIFQTENIRINKVDKNANQAIKPMDGAEFTLNFYAGNYDNSNLPKEATKSWVIKTMKSVENGTNLYISSLDNEHLVSGDPFYYGDDNIPVLPLGTLTLQETKAPAGYTVIGATYVCKGGEFTTNGNILTHITTDGKIAEIEVGNEYLVKDEREDIGVGVQIIKKMKVSDYWKEHGDPTFLFKIEGTDIYGKHHVYHESVTFTEDDKKAATGEYMTKVIKSKDLPYGTYEVTEEETARYKLKSITSPNGSCHIEGNKAVFDIQSPGSYIAEFLNEKYEWQGNSDCGIVVNQVNYSATSYRASCFIH